jgi:hypothetical protein
VHLSQLKPIHEPIASVKIDHDLSTGALTVFKSSSPVDILRRASSGLRATEAAVLFYGVDTPDDSDRKRAERELKRLVEKGRAYRREPDQGRDEGGHHTSVRYFYIADAGLQEEL